MIDRFLLYVRVLGASAGFVGEAFRFLLGDVLVPNLDTNWRCVGPALVRYGCYSVAHRGWQRCAGSTDRCSRTHPAGSVWRR